jgi:hypothetical protein
MRTFIIILCILAVATGAVVVYLLATTPKEARPLRFPLTAGQTQLLGHVPADAEAYALVPSPVVLMGKLVANPITRDPVTKWTDEHALPPASMLGRADAVVWKSGKVTSYAVRFDPVRAVIVRLWTMFSHVDARWAGRTLIINGGAPAATATPVELSAAAGLPEGDAFVVQRREARGAFPPIGRPALTSVRINAKDIDITSRAATSEPAAPVRPAVLLPASAMLSVAFTEPPQVLGDIDRLLAADIDALVGNGGTLALYRIDTGTLLPRPFMAIAVPANEATRATVARYEDAIRMVGQQVEQNGELVVAFDRNTAGIYIKDARTPMPWPTSDSRWALRLDPGRLIPVLRKVGDNPALRFATPRIHRGARDLRRWMGSLEHAASVEAASSVTGGHEELRVRVVSK